MAHPTNMIDINYGNNVGYSTNILDTSSVKKKTTKDNAGENVKRTVIIPTPKAIIFFIGGAGDKKRYLGAGPNYNIIYAYDEYVKRKNKDLTEKQKKLIIDKKSISYLGYYEVFGDINIQNNVINQIPSKHTYVYIIGHSLGGWNGAHLASKLSTDGYKIKMLITLDPVGERKIMSFFSDIYFWQPKNIQAEIWINIRCNGENYDISDFIADLGNQWEPPKEGCTYNVDTKVNHLDAKLILKSIVNDKTKETGLDLLIKSLKENVK